MWIIVASVLLTISLYSGKISANISASKFKEDLLHIATKVPFDKDSVANYSVNPRDVTFHLFTRSNFANCTLLDNYNPHVDTGNATIVFIVHGWTESRQKQWYEDLKNAFLQRPDAEYYVIQVDWKEPADQLYSVSAYNTRAVGHIIGDFILTLSKKSGMSPEKVLLVGHSLGGQVCGFAGTRVQKKTGVKLPRIIALDPAGPLFNGRPAQFRLDGGDARVVSVIHTDGGTFGFYAACGTIDFFPNGGSTQPGCVHYNVKALKEVSDIVLCDHHRSWEYFIEAVQYPDAFQATKCTNTVKYLFDKCDSRVMVGMGDLKTTETGQFYLTTNNKAPYWQLNDV